MATPIIMPKLELAQETATVIQWLKQEGEQIEKGEPVLVIETDKVTVEVEAPISGVLAGIQVEPEQVVPVTEVIAYILEPGEELPEKAEAPAETPPAVPMEATPVARRLAEARNVDLAAVEGTGPNERITKADVEAVLDEGASVEPVSEKIRATPAARRIAREHGLDLATVPGSGPGGVVQADDVQTFAAERQPSATPAGEVVPLGRMRRTIAERMSSSYRTIPHISFCVRVDMSAFQVTRARLNVEAQAANQPLVSVTALVVKAVAWTLKRHPWLNSMLRDEEIHLLPEINIGVAVALEEGLVVPVVHQADRKSIAAVAAEVNDLATRAREDRLRPSDVAEGTFTVSNLGPFGIEEFTAIINPPQAAILAVGLIQPGVVADEGGEVAVRPVMRMTLSADHRIVDGAIAARFLGDLEKVLEAPAMLLW
jgi:pyruvate dehydrogenase E2 component (dihydrolipoamide acetyltransferase)